MTKMNIYYTSNKENGIDYYVQNNQYYTNINNIALRLGGGEISVHSPIASWSYPTVFSIFLLGIISYCLIRIRKLKLPPLIIVGSMSGIFICSIYMIIWIIQLSNNMIENFIFGIPYLIIFPIYNVSFTDNNISYANFSMASLENILFDNSSLRNSSFQENKLKNF